LSDEEFTQEDRRKCEIKLHRLFAWVGVQYPEILELTNGRDHLQNFIFPLLMKNRLSDRDLNDIEALQHSLQEIKLRKEKELETQEMISSEGRKLCGEIAGLIRAIDTLKELPKMKEKGGLHHDFKENRIKDEKRWIKYINDVKK
jgi:hypothetical protein